MRLDIETQESDIVTFKVARKISDLTDAVI